MSFINVIENRRSLSPLKFEKHAKPIIFRSSRFTAEQSKKIAVCSSVSKIASALNYMYDENVGHDRSLLNNQIASAERCRVPVVRNIVVGYLSKCS